METTITVRRATADDVAGVDALLQRSYPKLLKADYPPSVMVLAVPILARAQPALVTCGTYYVAEARPGEILGAGGWTPKRGRPGAAEIRHFATDPAALRQGVGRAMMSRIFQDAGATGVRHYHCMATRTAVPFYRSMGFRTLGPIEIPLGRAISFPAIRMERSL